MGYVRKKKSTCSTVTFVYSPYLKKMKTEIKVKLQQVPERSFSLSNLK